jgi:hypothetical protein
MTYWKGIFRLGAVLKVVVEIELGPVEMPGAVAVGATPAAAGGIPELTVEKAATPGCTGVGGWTPPEAELGAGTGVDGVGAALIMNFLI